MGGTDAARFSINSSTGVVTFNSSPNYEAPSDVTGSGSIANNNVYDITVTAFDGLRSSTPKPVAITVTNLLPAVTGVAVTSATSSLNNTLNAGDVVSVTVSMSDATSVTTSGGTPTLPLNIGGSTVQASYASGSASTSLVFTYTILNSQDDANGISIDAGSVSLNGGVLSEPSGNASSLTFTGMADNVLFKVDNVAPSVTVTDDESGTGNVAGGAIVYTFTFSEAVTGFESGDITVVNGSVSSISGSGTTYTVNITPTANFEGNMTVDLASAKVIDIAGNANTAATQSVQVVDMKAPSNFSLANITLDLQTASDTGLSNTDNSTSATTPVITVSTLNGVAMAAGDILQVVDTSNSNAVVGSYSVQSGDLTSGNWNGTTKSITLSTTLADGTHALVARMVDATGNIGTAGSALSVVVDATAPTATNTSVLYDVMANTLTFTGTNYNSLLNSSAGETSSTDIKANLDWSKLSWDINGDGATTADVGFSLSDISSAKVTNSTTLTVVLSSSKGVALESTSGFGSVLSGSTAVNVDTIDIAGGFARDLAFNVSSSQADARADAALTLSYQQEGEPVISLGTFTAGSTTYTNTKLINPVQVDGGKWYYFWDRNGSGAVDISSSVDKFTHDQLDAIFIYNSTFTATNPNANTTGTSATYRYATINGYKVALPTVGDTTLTTGDRTGTAVGSNTPANGSNAVNSRYDDLLAVWDAFNGVGTTTTGAWNGTPGTWGNDVLLAADSTGTSNHASVRNQSNGFVYFSEAPEGSFYFAALQVLGSNDYSPVITSAATATFAENATGTVYTATAIDPDVVGPTLLYTLSGTDASKFNIDAITGALTFKVSPNYEGPTDSSGGGSTASNNVYDVIVSASDGVRSGSQAVAIAVTNVQPSVSGIVLSASGAQNGLLNAGDVVTATVTMTEPVTVTGTPQLALKVGSTTVSANYASGTGTTSLAFTYTIQAGQTDTNGISVDANTLALNGGALFDSWNGTATNATLTHSAIADVSTLMVDTAAPSVTSNRVSYNPLTGTLVINGTNFDSLLSSGETSSTNITSRLDWSKLSWDINSDNTTTANVSFTSTDISSTTVSNSSQLAITLTSSKKSNLEATNGYNWAGGVDSVDIGAGFAKDLAGNAAATDAVVMDGQRRQVGLHALPELHVRATEADDASGGRRSLLRPGQDLLIQGHDLRGRRLVCQDFVRAEDGGRRQEKCAEQTQGHAVYLASLAFFVFFFLSSLLPLRPEPSPTSSL